MSLIEQHQKIVDQYRDAGEAWPATSTEIARWAIDRKLWQIHPNAIVRQCADQIANAMREEMYKDPQGRRVRLLHAAPYPKNGRQYLLWDDMRVASHKHMHSAFQNRRQQIVRDCHQLQMDTDSYNQNFNKEKPIQMIFDFTLDLAEIEIMSETATTAA
jgi:hypothetical protein